ncbi:(2Fe-2S)-binding protein [Pedobacter sp. HMWF019]|uniref:Rieske (2Fe-2S) protein n=1 Tax=Pedobacter sp. HMWF019 TaxID=2056856 RepID=UPI000D3CCD8C|nr:Rieske (2Fe-2S) protein [Pedobacter sp. HMWF019]PTS97670.1 (2Fe-2S)-binding protein [Pedobacter sp. HMWF019]
MLKWYKIEIEIPETDFVEQIQVNGKKLCMIKDKGDLYVVQNTCPHAGGTLSGGWCKNGYLVCPIHRWEYSLENGIGAEGQGDYIHIYPTEQRKDGVYVGLREGWLSSLFKKG